MKILMYSDVHYAPGSRDSRKLTAYALPLIDRLKEIEKEKTYDLVVNLGDLVEDFGDHERDLKNVRFIYDYVKTFKAKHVSLLGNHDIKCLFTRQEMLEYCGNDKASYSFDCCGYHFVVLGTFIYEGDKVVRTQYVSDDDLVWLKNDLADNKLPVIVLTHYGLFPEDMTGSYWFASNPIKAYMMKYDEVRDVLKNHHVLACFNGHQHWTRVNEVEGLPFYTCGSLTENINGDGKPDAVYFEVDINDDKVDIVIKNIRMEG